MDTQRRRLEETVHSGAFSRAVEACGSSSNSHSRAVSGGVTIGSAHGNHGPVRPRYGNCERRLAKEVAIQVLGTRAA